MAKTGTGSQCEPKPCVHFVGFIQPALESALGKDPRYYRARRVFGEPDFVHRWWDVRAVADISPGDVVIFAEGTDADPPRLYSFDDSAYF